MFQINIDIDIDIDIIQIQYSGKWNEPGLCHEANSEDIISSPNTWEISVS